MHITAHRAPNGPYATTLLQPDTVTGYHVWRTVKTVRSEHRAAAAVGYAKTLEKAQCLVEDLADRALKLTPREAIEHTLKLDFGAFAAAVAHITRDTVDVSVLGDCPVHTLDNDWRIETLYTGRDKHTDPQITDLAITPGTDDGAERLLLLSTYWLTAGMYEEDAQSILSDASTRDALTRLTHASQVDGARPAAGVLLALA